MFYDFSRKYEYNVTIRTTLFWLKNKNFALPKQNSLCTTLVRRFTVVIIYMVDPSEATSHEAISPPGR